MAGIKDYSTTSTNNISLNGIDTNEGMLPSLLNNAIRNLMANTREFYNDSQWVEYGDGDGAYTSAWVSTTQFTIASSVNITAIYHVGRRLKILKADGNYVFGTITASSNNGTLQSITGVFDSGNLGASSNTLRILIGILTKTDSSIPTGIITTGILADGAVTTVKIADANVTTAKITDANVTTAKIANSNVTTAKIADSNVTTAKIADSNITTAKLATNAVTTAKITDANVTTAKIADSAITSAKIADGAIVNADINSSAAIDATKIANGTVTTAEFQYINTLSSNAQTQIDAKAATTYVDNAVAGLRTRIIAECASTANVNVSNGLEAGDAIDGITLVSGDRVLLKDQSTGSENGLYTAVGSGAGAASRDTQFNSIAELSGQMVVTNQGSVNDNKIFLCTTNNTASLGSDTITFTVITPNNTGTVTRITAGTGLSGGAITSAGTIAIDSTVATLAGAQTFTNKTYTSPKINENVAVTSTATELNKMAGGTSATGTTLLDADRLVVNDAGTMVQVALSDVKTYLNTAGYVTDDPTALAIALG